MRTREAKKVIRKIAKREGISEYEVRREMEKGHKRGNMERTLNFRAFGG